MRLAVVDDHPLVRQGIISMFSVEENMEIVGEAGSVAEAMILLKSHDPELVIVDIRLGSESGLELIKRAKAAGAACRFVVLTSSCNKEDFQEATKQGVDGYLLKEALPEEIISAVRLVEKGRKYYDPGLLELMMKEEQSCELDELTEREVEVLRQLGQGYNNRQIAQNLFIAESTVKKHVSQILSKLTLEDRTQAALYISGREGK